MDGADPNLHDPVGLFVGPEDVGRHRAAHLEGQVRPPGEKNWMVGRCVREPTLETLGELD